METEILGVRILNTRPRIFDFYKLISIQNQDVVYVFEMQIPFDPYRIPTQEEFELLDKFVRKRDGYGFIWPIEAIKIFGDRLILKGDLVHIYNEILTDQEYIFSNKKWDWAYYCHDDTLVYIFTRKEWIFELIKSVYEVEQEEYPSSIKKWLPFIDI